MKRLQPKAKEVRKLRIPDELRDSLREVFELIQEAKLDPDINLNFDDAIQVGVVCGGRSGRKPRPYEFTYRPTDERDRGRWYLQFHHTEIEDIADGRMTSITMNCCTTPGCGRKFRADDQHCDCDYVEDLRFGNFEFPAIEGTLAIWGVTGITQHSSRAEIEALLGPPDLAGGNQMHSFGFVWPWIKYQRADCQLRFEFNKTEDRLRMVSVMEKDWVPGKYP